MARAIRHRGPDGYGIASGGGAGLVSTRLAIFDIPSGWQPMQGAHRDTVMVYNGEVFNHYELRKELEAQRRALPHDQRHRDPAAPARPRRPGRAAPLQRPVGDRAPRPADAHAHADARPLRRPPAALRAAARRRHRLLERGQGHPRLRPRRGRRPTSRASTRSSRSGPRARRAAAFKGIRLLPPGHLLVWRDGEIVEERAWWRAALRDRRARARARGARRAAARLRAAAPARRRPRRLLPLGRPRLEPHDRARRRADRASAAHVLARVPRPAVRRVGVPAPGRRGARHAAPRDRDRARGDHRRLPGRHAPPRDAGHPLGRRAALPARAARRASRASRSSRRARAPTSCTGATTSSRRRRCARSARATPMPPGARRCSTACIRTSPSTGGRRGESWRRFFLDAGPAERSAVLAPDAHRGDLRRQVALLGRHARGAGRTSIRSSACATTCPRSSAA